jgi:hypothetical protein
MEECDVFLCDVMCTTDPKRHTMVLNVIEIVSKSKKSKAIPVSGHGGP